MLAGLPDAVMADEHRKGGDPTEIKVTMTNKTEETIIASFREQRHTSWFKFSFLDERGRRLVLPQKETARGAGRKELVRIEPDGGVSGYLSPK